jgi:thermitase
MLVRKCGSGWVSRAVGASVLVLAAVFLPAVSNAQSTLGMDYVPGRVLVHFKENTAEADAQTAVASTDGNIESIVPGLNLHLLSIPAGKSESDAVRKLKQNPHVEFAELDRILPPSDLIPNDYFYPNEWHLPKISAPAAWTTTTGLSTVIIAIADTGVDGTHEDLVSKLVPGWNIYDNTSDTHDVYGHGTEVAGVAAAATNNGIGVSSVCWQCSLMPVRIADTSGLATYSSAASGITWAADHGAKVVNLSYAMQDSSSVASAAQYLWNKGGILAVSAGNQGTFDSTADNPYMLVVSGTDSTDTLFSWSNTGNNIDLAAPGEVDATTLKGGGYSSAAGTSFSAPIVAGAAALLFSANPQLTPAQVTSLLELNADDLGPAGRDPQYGWGRLNIAQAMAAAGVPPPDSQPPAVAISSPTAGSTVSGAIAVQTGASDNVGVVSVTLKLDGTQICSFTAAPYSCSLNTASISNGQHVLAATASDAAGNSASASISVTVQNPIASVPPSIEIVSPISGTRVRNNVNISVSARDNTGVSIVKLYVDGQLSTQSTVAPFTMKWNAQHVTTGQHTLQAQACDAGQNCAMSASVVVIK